MGTTCLIYFLDDTTEVTAKDVPNFPGCLTAQIRTGLAEITLHGTHAQLTRLAAELAPDAETVDV